MTLEADLRLRRDDFVVEASLGVPAGKTVALLGPNGAGKSTIVSALAGLVPLDGGRVALDGRTLEDVDARVRVPAQDRPAGVVFQDGLLLPHLSAVENAGFPLRARGVPRRESRRKAMALLERLGVAHRAEARPGQLSGGEAQRVALARALIHRPRLLLLDEPLSALDVRARSEFRAVIREVLATFDGVRVLVTHDPVEAMTLADDLVLLEGGRVTQAGTPEEIRTRPRTPYAAELVGLNLFAGRLVPLPDGAGRLETAAGDIVVAWPETEHREIDGVLGLLRPADVSLHRERPEGSARNAFPGRVTDVAVEADRARVRLASRLPVVAEVTPASVERLAIHEGTTLWASFKAVEVEVVLP